MKTIEVVIKIFGEIISIFSVPGGMDNDDIQSLVESKLDEKNVPKNLWDSDDVEVDYSDEDLDDPSDSPDIEPSDYWGD